MDNGGKNNKSDVFFGALLAVSGSIVAVYQVKDPIILKIVELYPQMEQSVVESIFKLCLYVSVMVILFVIPVWTLFFISRPVAKKIEMFPGTPRAVVTERCKSEDLESIFRLARNHFGDRSSSLENIKRLYGYCPDSFWVIRRNSHNDTSKEVVGYYIIFSLKKEGVKAIHGGYYNGANPIPTHIHKSIRLGGALCVGAVVGSNLEAKAAAAAAATAFIESARQKAVYGKPINKEGLRFAKAKKMKKIDVETEAELNCYCYLNREV